MGPEPVADLSQLERRHVEQADIIAEIAGSVAHNFNNVLTLIRGRAELLLGQVESGRLDALQIQKGLQSIRKAAVDAGELLKRLREVMRPPRDDVPATVFDLNAAVLDAEGLLGTHIAAVAEAKGVNLRLTPRLVSASTLVSGRPSALREVLVNLVLNAIEAMPAGGEVTVETEREGPWVFLRVSDTGVGMSEETLTRAFTPFFTTKGPENMGLGLSSARALVRRYGGTISLESRPGAGTMVTVALPSAAPAPPEASAPPSLPPGLHVLVVEDEPAFAQVLVDFLTAQRSRVSVACAGHSALAQLEQGRYDLVITDLLLPEVAGREIARVAKQRTPECVVILLSGGLVAADDLPPDAAGADCVLTKPVDLPEFVRVAAALLARRPGRQG